jgi:hypothetical protein
MSWLLGLDTTFEPRPRNLFFDSAALRKVRAALAKPTLLSNFSRSLEEAHEALLACFYDFGREAKLRPDSPKQEPWMSFLSSEELEVISFVFLLF